MVTGAMTADSAGERINKGYVPGLHTVPDNPGGADHCRGAACVAYIQA